MLGNIIILGIAVGIILYAKRVFWSDLAKNPFFLWSAIGLSLVLIFSIILPNIDFVNSPFTPEIHGKVIDAETNKPMSNVIIIASWGYSYSELQMHSSIGTFTKHLLAKTDDNGEFRIGGRLRCLAFNMFPLYKKDSGGVMSFILYDNYKYTVIKAVNGYQYIYLSKLSTSKEMISEYSELISLKSITSKFGNVEVREYLISNIDNRLRQLYVEGVMR